MIQILAGIGIGLICPTTMFLMLIFRAQNKANKTNETTYKDIADIQERRLQIESRIEQLLFEIKQSIQSK